MEELKLPDLVAGEVELVQDVEDRAYETGFQDGRTSATRLLCSFVMDIARRIRGGGDVGLREIQELHGKMLASLDD